MRLRFFHLMFLPLDFDAGHLLEFALFVLPFILIYVWHIRHDHRHNTELISKLDETNRLLRRILRKMGSSRKPA